MNWAVTAAALILVAYPRFWGYSRHVVTLVHEASHALVALLSGRRLNSIHLHGNTSGVTTSTGRDRGLGIILTALAGYVGPSLAGLALAAMVVRDHADWALWAAVAMAAFVLLHIRNWFGLLVVMLSGGVVALVIWKLSDETQQAVALGLAWFLLIAAPLPVIELYGSRRRGRRTTDADLLARLTHIPAVVWVGVFLLLTVGALALGGWWLADALLLSPSA
ncbi:M50 family metallopeptidase [soil metagenome]